MCNILSIQITLNVFYGELNIFSHNSRVKDHLKTVIYILENEYITFVPNHLTVIRRLIFKINVAL